MKWLKFLSILFLSVSAQALTKKEKLPIYDFGKGVDTYHNSYALPDGFVQNAQNMLFDDKGLPSKAKGYTVAFSTKAYSFTNTWAYTDGTNTSWIIARSSDQITANNLAGSMVKIATVSVNDLTGETNAFGNAYFVDPTQGVYYWNGTSTTYVSGSPKGTLIATFHNRVWVTGASVPNGNQLYGSAYYNGSNWTTGVNDTDPVQYSIGLNDNFDNLTAEYVFLDTLYLAKHYSWYALYGFGQSTFQISQLTQECGCVDQNTIQTFAGGLRFVSMRGIEQFDGYHCTRISSPIKDKVDTSISLVGAAQGSWLQSSQADWQAGTFNTTNSLSATQSGNSLVVNQATFTESTSGFNGTVSTGADVSGSQNSSLSHNIHLLSSQPAGNVTNNSFETADFTGWSKSGDLTPNWNVCTCGAGGSCFTNVTGCDGNYAASLVDSDANPTLTMELIDNSSNILISKQVPASVQTVLQNYIFCDPNQINKNTKFRFHIHSSTHDSYLTTSNSFLCDTFTNGNTNCCLNFLAGFDGSRYYFDDALQGVNLNSSGTYISPSQDNLNSSNFSELTTFSAVNTSNYTPTLTLQNSLDNSSWSDVGSSTYTNYATNRFTRYKVTIAPTGTQDGNQAVTQVSYITQTSSGVFTSQSHPTPNASSYGNFVVQDSVPSGTTLSFSVCSSSSSTMVPKACVVQTPNTSISVATNSFVSAIATYTVTSATGTPTLNNFAIQWNVGHVTPMSSTIWDNRYWLALTTSTNDTSNDAILVGSQSGIWSVLDFRVGGLTQLKNSLYFSDATGTGNVYLGDQGYAKNGSAMNAFLQTKDFSLGDLSSDDYLYAVYPSIANTGNCAVTFQYDLDHSNNPFSLGSPLENEISGRSGLKLPFPIDTAHQTIGGSVNFTVGTNDNSCPFQFLGMDLLFKERPLR